MAEPPNPSHQQEDPYTPLPGSKGISETLDEVRTHLERLSPQAAYQILLLSQSPGTADPPAMLIDIRPEAQRAAEGSIPGAVIIERNVLEWRLDPRSDARLDDVGGRYDLRAVVFCSEGYTSSLAAWALVGLGLWGATDVVGGFRAWREAGMPWEGGAEGKEEVG